MKSNQDSIEGWHWHEGGFLTCDLLTEWRHGFFTRSYTQMPVDLQMRFYQSGQVYRIKQVHGDRVLEHTEYDPLEQLPEADGIWISGRVSDEASAWVCSADCVPVLIGDRSIGSVAAVHAGWRGTAAGIIGKTIERFVDRGSNLADLRIALGPAISGESYQVSQQVADLVLASIKVATGISPDPQLDRYRLDLRAVQQQQLVEIGVSIEQISIAPYCTLQTPEYFHSYRRNVLENPTNIGKSPQVQWSGIAIA